MGMVRVCRSSAVVVGVLCERIRSGCKRDEFLRESLHRFRVVGCRPAILDPGVAALRPPELLEPVPERRNMGLCFQVALGMAHQYTDPPHPLALLRARRERPSSRTAERGYQFPPSDVDWHVPLSVWGLLIERNDTTPRVSGLHVREGGDAGAASHPTTSLRVISLEGSRGRPSTHFRCSPES